MFQLSTGLAVSRRLRSFLGLRGARLSLGAMMVSGVCASASAQSNPPPLAIPDVGTVPTPVGKPDMVNFQPMQSVPDTSFPPLTMGQAEEKIAPKAGADPKTAAPPNALPAPRPYVEERPRMTRLGSSLGKTPTPSPEDFAVQQAKVEGVIDPMFTLDLIEGRARIINLKEIPTQIQLADEGIATFAQLNPRQLSITGKKTGTTVFNMWFADPKDKTKELILSYLIRVVPDPEVKERLEKAYKALEDEINKAYPNSRVKLALVGDKLIVSGQAHDIFDANQILRIARYNSPGNVFGQGQGGGPASTGNSRNLPVNSVMNTPGDPNDPLNPSGTPGQESYFAQGSQFVINHLRVPGEQQVMLRVIVAEVNRAAARSIGVNFALFNPSNNVRVLGQLTGGLLTGGVTTATALGSAGASANLPVNLDNGRIPVAINALRTLNYARSLAEPNLTTMNGQTARFLAGGQFPVPVLGGIGTTGSALGGGGLEGVAFVPYGVQLSFTPYVTDRDRIRLNLNATVSTRDLASGTQIQNSSVPGLNSRTFSSTVEMREGQTLAVAGLIQTNIAANATRVPFFGDLPLIGRLAAYDQTTSGEQELVVLVTPELVHPMNQNGISPLPGSDLFEPSDIEFYLCGRLESRRTYDYRSAVMTDIQRMHKYRSMENQYIIGPTGHSEHLLGRPLSATTVGR
jgi:pilus assembly protein CpaC